MHTDGTGWVLRPDQGTLSGWRLAGSGVELDEWLAEHDAAPMADRLPVLAYGSNACPAKVTWLREALGLTGPAVVLVADCAGLAAVWTTGTRPRDGQRTATLMAAPGLTERHAIWYADAAQLEVLDVCEVRDQRYRLVRLNSGRIALADGAVLDNPLAYLGLDETRLPLVVNGAAVRCAEVDQAAAIELTGTGGVDGLAGTEVIGQPDPLDWPDRVFVYGTLGPGGRAWPFVAPYLRTSAYRAFARGRLYDSGNGYPALVPSAGEPAVPGFVLTLREPAEALPELDRYEGPRFTRARTVLADGSVCWVYYWNADVAGLPEIPAWL